jgi:hypothetical protein
MTDMTCKYDDEGEVQDLGELARTLRTALLVTDAALPLHGAPRGATPESQEPIVRDRSALRGIAFRAVLRDLGRYEYQVRPADLEALIDGRVPEPPAPWRRP